MKTLSLPYVTRKSLKENRFTKGSVEYQLSEKILIFFTADGSEEQFKQMRRLQQNFQTDKKQVSFLYLLLKDEQQPNGALDDHMIKLNKKDIGFMGEIKDDRVLETLDQEYDFLIHADIEPNVYADFVLSKIKARCRIGQNDNTRERYYDFMIETEEHNNLELFLNQVYYYAKML